MPHNTRGFGRTINWGVCVSFHSLHSRNNSQNNNFRILVMHKFAGMAAKLVPLRLKTKRRKKSTAQFFTSHTCRVIDIMPNATVRSCAGCYITVKRKYTQKWLIWTLALTFPQALCLVQGRPLLVQAQHSVAVLHGAPAHTVRLRIGAKRRRRTRPWRRGFMSSAQERKRAIL